MRDALAIDHEAHAVVTLVRVLQLEVDQVLVEGEVVVVGLEVHRGAAAVVGVLDAVLAALAELVLSRLEGAVDQLVRGAVVHALPAGPDVVGDGGRAGGHVEVADVERIDTDVEVHRSAAFSVGVRVVRSGRRLGISRDLRRCFWARARVRVLRVRVLRDQRWRG